jgi:hypothetical protein
MELDSVLLDPIEDFIQNILAMLNIEYLLSGNQMQYGRRVLPTIPVAELGLPHKYSTKFLNWFACRSHPLFQYLC